MLDLVGLPDVGVIISRTGERVRQLYKAGQMPPPAAICGRQVFWEREQIEQWCRVVLGREPVPTRNPEAESLCSGQFEIPFMASG